jgi:hypothetical protein
MLHQTKESFEVAEDFDFEEFMRPSFGVYQGEPVKVRCARVTERVVSPTLPLAERVSMWGMLWGIRLLDIKKDLSLST